ncbi:MAG TPA: hypothetical protein VE465_20235 [Streptosporangiaceae bacterium]|nr:hypothetical protein [Streptosporangiaceae bacterium]
MAATHLYYIDGRLVLGPSDATGARSKGTSSQFEVWRCDMGLVGAHGNDHHAPEIPRRVLTMDDIVRIATYRDRKPDHQAKVVALAYHQLANELALHLGTDVNTFYSFATWGSKAVGEQLDLTRRSPFWTDVCERLKVPKRFRRPLRRLALTLLGDSFQLGLSLANRAVFLETASLGADLWREAGDHRWQVRTSTSRERASLDLLPDGRLPADVRRPAFLSSLLGPAKDDYLDKVVRLLTEARHTDDPALRAELILGANVALVAYEQSRCQPLLQLVFYRPMRWLFRVSWRSLRSRLTGQGFRRFWIYTARHADQPPLVRWAERTWATIYTKHVMSMRTPAGTVRLGKPMRPPRGVDPDLLRAPIRHPEVRRLVECFVPDPERATAGVTNWLDYRERMRYIVTYFRVYHTAPELLDPPFTPPIADALEADMWKGDPPRPLKEWYETKVAAYKTKTERRGVRGFILRRLYRSPIVVDPDAAELADLDLMDFISERRLDDRTEHEPPSER